MPETSLFFCPKCRANVQLVVDGRCAPGTPPDEPPSYIQYWFGHCVRCTQPAIVEYEETGPNGWDREWKAQVYPPLARTVNFEMPPLVSESFQEAFLCESTGAYIATAVMVRRALEAISREFDPDSRNLAAGLNAMKTAGVIGDEIAQWGHELRFLGNIGAHPSADDRVTREDAREAIDFLMAIAEIIYHLRPKFQAMRSRRSRPVKVPNKTET